MLNNTMFYPTLPASDLRRARAFYEGKLGFEPIQDADVTDGVFYQVGDQAILLYETAAPRGGNTALSFVVQDLDAEMEELRNHGITFEEYDQPGLKTEKGVAELDGMRGAWFKDSEDNILSVSQPSEAQLRMMKDRRSKVLAGA